MINAVDATKKALAVALAKEKQEEQEKILKEKQEKEKQEKIDKNWAIECYKVGERIIKLMIENGQLKGEIYKTNRFIPNNHNQQNGCCPEYSFSDKISDNAINEVIKYFNSYGYGCEIKKPVIAHDKGYEYLITGTMYLWFLDEPNNKEIFW